MHQIAKELGHKKCVPCASSDAGLSRTRIKELLNGLSEWSIQERGKWLKKDFKFKSFCDALHFVNKVGEVAELHNHHPDISFGWGYANVRLQTHAIGGLHENDFIIAACIDTLRV